MKKLIDECSEHSYIYLKTESVAISHPTPRIINKEVYVCVDCGSGQDVYDLENFVEIPKSESE